jgi:hypothetical protein
MRSQMLGLLPIHLKGQFQEEGRRLTSAHASPAYRLAQDTAARPKSTPR